MTQWEIAQLMHDAMTSRLRLYVLYHAVIKVTQFVFIFFDFVEF